MYEVDSGIVRLTHTENNFVLGIVEQAMATETFIHFRISALERLKNGNWREIPRGYTAERGPSILQKPHSASQTDRVVADAGKRPQRSQQFNQLNTVVNHS